MNPGGLLIRADAGPEIGSGHAMRMLALAEAWLTASPLDSARATDLAARVPPLHRRAQDSRGDRVYWLGDVPDAFATRLADAGIERVTGEVREVADRLGLAWVVADGYHFGDAWQRKVRGGVAKLMVVDDNAENAPYVADAVLNVNVHAAPALYARREPHTELLLGTKYALLRREFQTAPAPRAVPPKATRWLVTMGGADPVNATGRFLAAFSSAPPPGVELEVLVGGSNPRLSEYRAIAPQAVFTPNPPDVTVPMRRAELAFSASGGTVWELALMGVPAAVISLADNQLSLRDALAQLGVVESLGDSSGDARKWLGALTALAADPQRRAGYVRRAREQVDGQGAHRVVAALRGQTDAEL